MSVNSKIKPSECYDQKFQQPTDAFINEYNYIVNTSVVDA